MKYMGSKSKIAKEIVPILQKYIQENNIKNYVEPFVGGANIIDKIVCRNKIGNDNQKYLIELFNNLEKINYLPDTITKEHYSDVRNSYNCKDKRYEDWYIGAVGFLSSYNGRFFDGGYSGVVKTKNGGLRNYYMESLENLKNQSPNLKNITFIFGDYKDINVPKNSLVYCDPPYIGTKQYNTSRNFNYKEYWEWVREISKYSIVICSELQAPKDFKCIWEKEVNRTIDNNKTVKQNDKLFVKI